MPPGLPPPQHFSSSFLPVRHPPNLETQLPTITSPLRSHFLQEPFPNAPHAAGVRVLLAPSVSTIHFPGTSAQHPKHLLTTNGACSQESSPSTPKPKFNGSTTASAQLPLPVAVPRAAGAEAHQPGARPALSVAPLRRNKATPTPWSPPSQALPGPAPPPSPSGPLAFLTERRGLVRSPQRLLGEAWCCEADRTRDEHSCGPRTGLTGRVWPRASVKPRHDLGLVDEL